MTSSYLGFIQEKIVQYGNILIALAFALSGLMPIILSAQTQAAQLTNRKVTITDSTPSATGISYAFNFNISSTTPVQSIAFSFCTTPLGTCVLPTGMNVGTTAAQVNSTQTFTQATAFTEQTTTAGGCSGLAAGSTATQYCVKRTAASNEDTTTNPNKAITIDGITNPSIPSGNNTTVYVRIALYSDTAFATSVYDGTVAASIVNQLTVSGRVAERLVFCVFALDDAAGSSGTVGASTGNMPADCSATEANQSTNIDIGVIDNQTFAGSPNSIPTSPVDNNPPTYYGNDRFGAAMINTNATNGVALTYYASAATSGTNELRAFRVPGATCIAGGASLTDQCFVSASSSGETFSIGTERFGLQIACVANSTTTASGLGTTSNLGKTAGSYVDGSGTSGSYNSAYDAGNSSSMDDTTATDDCENTNTSRKFAWNASSTAAPLISSTTVVDDEMVKLRFGATASATTPTGSYTVASTYIATPTY